MRFLSRSLTGLFLLAVTIGLLIYAVVIVTRAIDARLSQDPFVPQVRERAFAVNLQRALPEAVVPVMTAYGEVESRRRLELRAPAPGAAVWLAPEFAEGGQVRAGDLLLRVDPTTAQAALDRAATDLSDAEAEVLDAGRALLIARDTLVAAQDQANLRQKALERQEQLVERSVGAAAALEEAELNASSARQSVLASRNALAQAEARVDSAATALRRAELTLTDAERDLADTEIRAAFDGALSGVTLSEGRLLAENEVLAELIDPAALQVAFRVSAAQFARLLDEEGQLLPLPLKATLDLSDVDISAIGQLRRSGASVGEGQTGRLIIGELDSAQGLKPGDFVTVHVEEPELAYMVRLPATAIDSSSTVLVVDPDGRLELLPVTLHRRQGNDILVQGEGLEGREVVTERSPLLGPGILALPLVGGKEAAATTGAAAVHEAALIELTPEHRARLVAFVEKSAAMPGEVKLRLLGQLEEAMVPASMVARLESRMGG